MAEVVVLHSALGLRPGIAEAVRRLREHGHDVHAPDLYDGHVFDGGVAGYAAGMAYLEAVGWTRVVDRAWEAVERLRGAVVYLGFSMGAGIAQELAINRPGARGAVLVAGGGAYDDEPWPLGVPVDAHHMVDDAWLDEFAPVRLVRLAARAGACSSVYLYPGDGHLFMDAALPEEYHHEMTELLWRRVMRFLIRMEHGLIPSGR